MCVCVCVFFLRKLFIVRKFIQEYFRGGVYQRIDWWTTLARIFRRQYTRIIFTHIRNTYRRSEFRNYNQNCAYFGAFLTTDSAGPTSTDTNRKLMKTDAHVYGTLWLTEITKSSVTLADT
jgi:hypothetical protein